jgi:sirohydrochlorin cobaltochelatase
MFRISLLATSICLFSLALPAAEDMAHQHHADHDMSSAEMDAEGRRLYGMTHDVTDAAADELRGRIDQFAGYDTAAIQQVMDRMGSNYEWYISDLALMGNTGVLVLAHGFRDPGDDIFRQRLNPLASQNPTALAMGMSMMMSDHIQLAINDLEAAGAKRIVVVPLVSNRYNSLLRQWQYIFGLIDEPAYNAVPPVTSNVELIFGAPPETDPLIVATLVDYASEISEDPKQEFLLLVAHGPEAEADNEVVLGLLEELAVDVQNSVGFAAVGVASLQDDAPKAVRAANVAGMRQLVERAQADGYKVLVITNLLAARAVQSELRRDLRGLDYTFNAKGLVQHDNFIRWIEDSVAKAVASSIYF